MRFFISENHLTEEGRAGCYELLANPLSARTILTRGRKACANKIVSPDDQGIIGAFVARKKYQINSWFHLKRIPEDK